MIPVVRLLYQLDRKLNKLSSNEHQKIPVENKILALNEAQKKLIKLKLNSNNPLQIGLDGNKKRYEDIENLIEPAEKHPLPLVEVDDKLNKWVADPSDIIPAYMFYIESYIIADKEDCKNRIIYINNDLVAHGSVTTLLNNTNYKPSFEYQETFCTFSSGKEEIYTDGTFTPKTLFLSYIRYPKKIDKEGYVDFDGTESIDSDCELYDYLEDELLDLTVEELAINTENVMAAQGASKSESETE